MHSYLNVLGNKTSGAVTLGDTPEMDEMLARLSLSKYFISLDLRSRYYHIKLSPATRHKGTFTFIFGNYKVLECLLDFFKGQPTSQLLGENCWGKFNDVCFFHVGDVMVCGKDEEDYQRYIKQICE